MTWWAGPVEPHAVIFGLPVYWLVRIGKLFAFLGTWVIIFDVAGEDRIASYARRIASGLGRLQHLAVAEAFRTYLLVVCVLLYAFDSTIVETIVFHQREGHYPNPWELVKFIFSNIFNFRLLGTEMLYGLLFLAGIAIGGFFLSWIVGQIERAFDRLAASAQTFFASEKLRARTSLIALVSTVLGFCIDIFMS
ncbi:MAG TPA: hypothetical protein VGN17_08855 [Bryobacteraceae bacterium]|jgi:hypothetical protein